MPALSRGRWPAPDHSCTLQLCSVIKRSLCGQSKPNHSPRELRLENTKPQSAVAHPRVGRWDASTRPRLSLMEAPPDPRQHQHRHQVHHDWYDRHHDEHSEVGGGSGVAIFVHGAKHKQARCHGRKCCSPDRRSPCLGVSVRFGSFNWMLSRPPPVVPSQETTLARRDHGWSCDHLSSTCSTTKGEIGDDSKRQSLWAEDCESVRTFYS